MSIMQHNAQKSDSIAYLWAIKALRNAIVGGGLGHQISRKNRYEGVWFNVISITRGWMGVKFPGKKRYVTLEWSRM